MNLREKAKSWVYRTPLVHRLMAPSYRYKVNPGQLAAMISLMDDTRSTGASIAEVGVARGTTSVFLLEHLRTTGDPRTLNLFDTFDGFTAESVSYEVEVRGKHADDYGAFRYGNEARFTSNLKSAGYANFRTIRGDAATFDWASLSPIGAVLLDIDLYEPTRKVLDAVWPHLVDGGGIVVDDCLADTPWDGSLQAYSEFVSLHSLPFERVGAKGALVRKVMERD